MLFKYLYFFLFILFSTQAHSENSTLSSEISDIPKIPSHMSAHTKLCYIPGIEGGTEYSLIEVPLILKSKGIPFLIFRNGGIGTVQKRAESFRNLLEAELQLNPDLRCHLVSYSMGGIVGRYALNHLYVNHPQLGRVSMSQFFITQMSIASPHRGTPIARLLKNYVGSIDPAVEQLTEEAMETFNLPSKTETYSPVIEGLPFFSFRSYLKPELLNGSFIDNIGYKLLAKDLATRNLHTANDGVVPTASQTYGVWLADLNIPHTFFTTDYGIRPSSADFLEAYWKFLSQYKGANDFKNLNSLEWSTFWNREFQNEFKDFSVGDHESLLK